MRPEVLHFEQVKSKSLVPACQPPLSKVRKTLHLSEGGPYAQGQLHENDIQYICVYKHICTYKCIYTCVYTHVHI